ncbi:Fe2+-dicitrate sensor, membrane component [plant metagenome]|uniref:Fe2+-dicitrate sensor, membrane component n=1 Tax=plant metagenome TaxID=1297885 RepID=A0A484RDL4_9ZZZZ
MSAKGHAPASLPPHAVLEEAADWFALLASGHATDADRAGWRAWLDAEPSHRQAWGYLDRLSQRFEPLQRHADPAQIAQALGRPAALRKTRRRTIAAMVLLGVGGWAAWRQPLLREGVLALAADYRGQPGGTRQATLPDGTRVWLNAGSAMNLDYGTGLRRLILMKGEILVDTAHEARPLVVDTAHGRLRALGTRFTVWSRPESTLLAVHQGAVEVSPAQGGEPSVVEAGHQLRFTASQIGATEPADPAREAWHRGILLARDIPLSDVVETLSLHWHGHLSLSPAVADLRVVGGFPLHDLDRTLALLGDVVPIQTRRPFPWWVSIEAKH